MSGLYRDSISVFYPAADVNGLHSNLKFSTFNAGTWTEHGTTVTAGVKIEGFQPSNAAFNQTYLPLNGLLKLLGEKRLFLLITLGLVYKQ